MPDGEGALQAGYGYLSAKGQATDVQGHLTAGGGLLSGTGTMTPWVESEFTRRAPLIESAVSVRQLPRRERGSQTARYRRAPAWPGRHDTYHVD